MTSVFHPWEGVFASFEEAPAEGPGFAGDRWRQASLALANETSARESRSEALDFSLSQRNAVLPAVAATVRHLKGRVRILDIGGGLGNGYTVLRAALLRLMQDVSYDILEVPEVLKVAADLPGREGLRFLSEFPRDTGGYDIVYMASSLQYMEDWKALLADIARLSAQYILLSDTLAGHTRSFVALQNYYESKIPSWFFNEDELISTLKAASYKAVLKTSCVPRVLGNVGALPMANFPAENRIEHAWHYLFGKE